MLGLAITTWLASFSLLLRPGTRLQYALAGALLAGIALWSDADARALVRPSHGSAGMGLAAGLVMVALTHAAFHVVAPVLPELRASTARLLALADVGGLSLTVSAALIVAVAACEEVIFRGALAGAAAQPGERRLHAPSREQLLRVVALAAAYALAMVTLGSPLLVACAFACGLLWGALRVATRSLIAPITAHVVWDLGVLIVWPVL